MSLEQQMRHILIRLELVSHGTTQTWNSAGGHTDNPDPTPNGCKGAEHLHYRDRWNGADSDEQREHVIRSAQRTLDQLTRRTAPIVSDPTIDRDMLDQDIARKLEQRWPVREIAFALRITERRVRQAAERVTESSRAVEVRELADQGLTVRFIAAKTGVAKSTVHDILKRRNAA